jgi:biopolymer transport protein ExbB/TolQ/gas vesicle protein
MDHLTVTLAIAVACAGGGVALYILFLRPAVVSLAIAEEALATASRQIGTEDFDTYSQRIDPHTNETHQFVKNLIQQARSGVVNVDIEGALGDTKSRLSGLIVWPRFYAQLAVYIGLLGTILGLWMALASLQGATQIHDESSLRTFASSTRELLGSLQGAFISALAGVLVTSLLGWRVQHFDHATDQYVDRLDRFARERLLPNLEGLRLHMLPQSGIEAAQLIVTQLDKTLGSFTRAWGERFKVLAQETAILAETSGGLYESTKALETSADTLAEITVKLDTRLDSLISASNAASAVAEGSLGIMSSASTAVAILADRAQQWPDLSLQLQQTSYHVAAASESLRASTQQLNITTSGFEDSWSGLSDKVHKLSADSFKELNEEFVRSVEEIVRRASSELTSVVSGVHARDVELSQLANRVGTAVEQQGVYSSQLADSVYKMYALIPPLEDPRPALETMLASLRAVSQAILARADQMVSHEPEVGVAPASTSGVKEGLVGIQVGVESLSAVVRSTQGISQVTNQKLDRIAGLLEELIRTEGTSQQNISEDPGNRRKGWWPRGR